MPTKQDWRTAYVRYRIGRLKHQYWLWNRKRPHAPVIDYYDKFILQNCQPGHTVFFSSSAYYLKDIFGDITVVEQYPVVKTFRPDVIISTRSNLKNLDFRSDNLAVVNNRSDQWYDLSQRNQMIQEYCAFMNHGCRFFYSFRDTQIPKLNRLKIDQEQYWLAWAQSLANFGLDLCWHSIEFPRKQADANGDYNTLENPDTTNGNLKFIFVYKDKPFTVCND